MEGFIPAICLLGADAHRVNWIARIISLNTSVKGFESVGRLELAWAGGKKLNKAPCPCLGEERGGERGGEREGERGEREGEREGERKEEGGMTGTVESKWVDESMKV